METYYEPEHPLQRAVREKINMLCEVKDKYPSTTDGCGGVNETCLAYPVTTDGCGVPILSMPLYNMLVGYINLLKYDRIVNSILNHPYIFGGENRLDTEIIQNTHGILAKVGAGGLCIVVNVQKKMLLLRKLMTVQWKLEDLLFCIQLTGWAGERLITTIKLGL